VNHTQEIFHMVFVPDNQPPEVLKPGKQALYLPSAPIASQFPAVLGIRFFTSFAMGCDHFDTSIIKESIVKWIAVVRLITNQLVRGILSKAAVYRILDKFYLVGRSAFHVSGDRKTRSVCNCHDLGAFAALCLADSKTPFFAGAKLPSMNASRISILPRSFRSSTSSGQCAGKLLAGPIAGTACGRSGMADTVGVNLSRERLCA
jgi:hypothetical protein